MEINPNQIDSSFVGQLQALTGVSEQQQQKPEEKAKEVDPVAVEISQDAREFVTALTSLDEAEAVRPEAVERGKALIENWQSPTDADVDVIVDDMLEGAQ